jgi:lysyl-tRNA synthetase class 2
MAYNTVMKNWQKIKSSPELLTPFLMREKVIDGIRYFFKSNDFREVETPLMVKYPGTEPFLEVFQTKLEWADGKSEQAFMLTSPEFAMKKLLVAGMKNIFQVCKSFRNGEGNSSRHNPEFTILEWYRSDATYEQIMIDCQNLLLSLANQVSGKSILDYQGRTYDLDNPWVKLSVADAFSKWVSVSIDELLDRDALFRVAQTHGYQVDKNTTWEELYNQLFLNLIEPQLAQYSVPVILYDYPASQAAYSKKKVTDPRFAERFEFYLAGYELGNAFSEENDPQVQEAKFKEDLALRKELGKTDYGMDKDYIEALKSGLPPSGGIAVGVDRLVMLFANTLTIQETMFFPATEVFSE